MKSVLVCDGEGVVRTGLRKSLEALGFDEISVCADGQAAVRLALDTVPDIAILGVTLPKKDGMSAAAEIRERLKIPILLLSAAADAETVERAKRLGIAAFLMKPLREQDLWPAIELACAHNDEIEQLKEQVEDLRETLESRKLVEKAKGALMRNFGMTEPEAFRKMQKLAMDKRKSLKQIAEAILLVE